MFLATENEKMELWRKACLYYQCQYCKKGTTLYELVLRKYKLLITEGLEAHRNEKARIRRSILEIEK